MADDFYRVLYYLKTFLIGPPSSKHKKKFVKNKEEKIPRKFQKTKKK